jgi:hypothetical protein
MERWTEFKAGEKFWPQRFFDESNSNAGERTPPTLTDEEREAVAYFAAFHQSPREADASAAATLRKMLERLGGGA